MLDSNEGRQAAFEIGALQKRGQRSAKQPKAACKDGNRARREPPIRERCARHLRRTVAAGIHGRGKRIGAAKQSDEQRDEHGLPRAQTFPKRAVVEGGAARLLGIMHSTEFFSRHRDKPKCEREHGRDIVDRQAQPPQRTKENRRAPPSVQWR